jgi:uncharacterized delta-60 repeat protein
MKQLIVYGCLFCSGLTPVFGQSFPYPDSTFNDSGLVVSSFPSGNQVGRAIAVQPDGKIIAGGFGSTSLYNYNLVRYLTDGRVDSTFGANGMVTTPVAFASDLADVCLQSTGKIIAGGYYQAGSASQQDFLLIRYLPNGTIDSAFGANGRVLTDFSGGNNEQIHALAIQSDDKIVAVGEWFNTAQTVYNFAIARYMPDGSPDSSFNGTGKLLIDMAGYSDYAKAVVIQPDGKIVVAGTTATASASVTEFCAVRLTAAGAPDPSFGIGGKAILPSLFNHQDYCEAMVLQSDGKYVLAGNTSPGNGIIWAAARLRADGTIDSTYNSTGWQTFAFNIYENYLQDAAIDAYGNTVLVGSTVNDLTGVTGAALASINTAGLPDPTFGSSGMAVFEYTDADNAAYANAFQPDGRLLIVGEMNSTADPSVKIYTARFRIKNEQSTGIENVTRNGDELFVFPNPFGDKISFVCKDPDIAVATIEIYDNCGRLVHRSEFTGKEWTINTGSWNEGVYLFRMSANGTVFQGTIIR